MFRVGDLVTERILAIGDGYRMRNEELGVNGTPFVRGGDIGNGWIDHKTIDHIRPDFASRIGAKLTLPWDVAFITKGTVGRVGILRPEQPQVVFAPQVAYWRSLDHDRLHPRFIYYLLSGPEFQARLDADKTHGAMVADYVSISQQHDFRLTIPDIHEQRAIARILGALDDKIELNRRTNATLEAMARALFKSWFIDASFGALPDGWREGCISDVATNRRDTVHPNEVLAGSAYVGLEHMPRGHIFLEDLGAPDALESLKAKFDAGEILFGKLRPYFKKVALAPCAGICSTDILVLRPKLGAGAFTLLLAASDAFIEHAVALSDGTKMPRTSWEQITRYPIAVPPISLLHAFEEVCTPLFARAESLRHESHTLAGLRDTLLPRLLSGELSASDAEAAL